MTHDTHIQDDDKKVVHSLQDSLQVLLDIAEGKRDVDGWNSASSQIIESVISYGSSCRADERRKVEEFAIEKSFDEPNMGTVLWLKTLRDFLSTNQANEAEELEDAILNGDAKQVDNVEEAKRGLAQAARNTNNKDV